MLHYNVLFHVNHLGCLARRFSLSPTNLHCSQTHTFYRSPKPLFVSPTNLHYSQTVTVFDIFVRSFVSPTNLHYSQTDGCWFYAKQGLFPLRIYTTLKRKIYSVFIITRLFPLRIYTTLKLPMQVFYTR